MLARDTSSSIGRATTGGETRNGVWVRSARSRRSHVTSIDTRDRPATSRRETSPVECEARAKLPGAERPRQQRIRDVPARAVPTSAPANVSTLMHVRAIPLVARRGVRGAPPSRRRRGVPPPWGATSSIAVGNNRHPPIAQSSPPLSLVVRERVSGRVAGSSKVGVECLRLRLSSREPLGRTSRSREVRVSTPSARGASSASRIARTSATCARFRIATVVVCPWRKSKQIPPFSQKRAITYMHLSVFMFGQLPGFVFLRLIMTSSRFSFCSAEEKKSAVRLVTCVDRPPRALVRSRPAQIRWGGHV